MLQGRSAPAKSLVRAPGLRTVTAVQGIPSDCGIDPVTGEICAGDPSIVLHTNVKMGDKKVAFMTAVSKAIASSLGKPESYVAVCVNDGCDMIWGGENTPCALGSLYSLGAINMENNKKVTAEITKLLSEFNVPANKMYINFFDVPRENCGYNGATFAG
jgi:phenylpyruvate tautomerase